MFYDFNSQPAVGSFQLEALRQERTSKGTESFGNLLSDCRRGNRTAQKSLYRRYYAQCMMVCHEYTHNESDAIDLMNAAWERVYRRVNRRTSVARFEAILKQELRRQLQPKKFRLFSFF